jgi:hypothetical protein
MGFGLDDWVYWQHLLQILVITINYKNSIFSRTLLPWLPRSLPILVLVLQLTSESESQSHFTTGGLPPISSSWSQAPCDPRPIFFQLNACCHSPYTTCSLTRGWVCRLQLLLVLASAFIVRSESHRIHDHILRSQIQDSSNLEVRSPYLYPPGTGWPSYTTSHCFPFPSPFTTRGATVAVIRIRLHTLGANMLSLDAYIHGDRIQNTAPHGASTFCVRIRSLADMNWLSRVSCYERRSVGQSAPEQSSYLGPTIRLPSLSDSRVPPDAGHPPPIWGGVSRSKPLPALASAVNFESRVPGDPRPHSIVSDSRLSSSSLSNLADIYGRFRGIYYLHIQEGGGNIFLGNVGKYLTHYPASHTRR